MCGLLAATLVCVARAQQPQPESHPRPESQPPSQSKSQPPSQLQPQSTLQPSPTNDLDQFMARVLERRSQNWRTLRDYVLNEKEHFELLGPGRAHLFGTQREFTWYLRDGVLVRSPVRFDGVKIGDTERKRYEDNWTRQEHQREERRARRLARANPAGAGASAATETSSDGEPDENGDGRTRGQVGDVAALAREGAEPRFISQAYFMNFHFEPGNYYLAGRETLEGREVLRIEYYPTHLFDDHHKRRTDKPDAEEQEFERKFNKVALITLWVDPQEHQIVKFTFTNVDFGFLPGRWLVRADDMTASMVMSQPIQGIWLPREISGSGRLTLANGTYELRYGREFFDYQQGEVKTKIRSFTPKDLEPGWEP
jgi:hypothetical protein